MRFLSNPLLIFFLVVRGSGVSREHCGGCGGRLLVFCRYMTTPNQSMSVSLNLYTYVGSKAGTVETFRWVLLGIFQERARACKETYFKTARGSDEEKRSQ